VTARLIGYKQVSRDLAIQSGRAASADFRLRPLTVPDLPVVRIDVGVAQGVALLRIVQTLRDGGRLEMVEALRPVRFEESAGSGAQLHKALRRGEVWIALAAPDHLDELASLLEPMK